MPLRIQVDLFEQARVRADPRQPAQVPIGIAARERVFVVIGRRERFEAA